MRIITIYEDRQVSNILRWDNSFRPHFSILFPFYLWPAATAVPLRFRTSTVRFRTVIFPAFFPRACQQSVSSLAQALKPE